MTLQSTIQSICKSCDKPILLGEPVKVTWNDEQDEHIICPAPKTITAKFQAVEMRTP
jgi:RNase P subunit RPR2